MAVVGETVRASVGRQVLRGIGILVAGATALVALGALVSWVGSDDTGQAGVGRRLGATAVVLALVSGGYVTLRRLRRWSERPRWLVPAAAAIMLAASVPAGYADANAVRDNASCLPILQAWEPSMAQPSAADLAYYEAVFRTPMPHGRAALVAFSAAQELKQRAPAFQRVRRFGVWLNSDASCAPSSRSHLSWSAAGLGVGAAALTVAIRRRRTG